ncbi:MAG TPA: glycosyltransferase [Rhizomicrobium sp.]|nr:glycosyltransferase [Rhizomicrobium sp.]
MKIVHASHFSIRDDGSNFYAIQYKLSSGLTRLGHFVFNYSDRDVANANPFRIRALGHGRANAKLVAVCREIRPDLLLLGHCTIITPETVSSIRAAHPGIRIAHWNCDGLFVEKNLARLRALAPLVDMTFVTTAGEDLRQVVESDGRATFMPNPIDKAIENLRVFERNDVANDLIFLTGFNAYDKEKLEICDTIRAQLPELKFDVRGLYGIPGVYGADVFDVLANAKMGLNISKRNDIYLYSSDRMAQLMGLGILALIDKRTRFDEIFGPDELVTYDGVDDLIGKLDYFRKHDDARKKIAENGWRRAHDIFSETVVAQWILDRTFDGPLSRTYAWPTEIIQKP